MRENNLARFIKAQDSDYKTALAEIKSGHKRNCWMWYIFPQIQGLGSSGTAMYYAIENYEEAKEYIENPVTGAHLREISETLLSLESNDATQVMCRKLGRREAQSATMRFAASDGETARSKKKSLPFALSRGASPRLMRWAL